MSCAAPVKIGEPKELKTAKCGPLDREQRDAIIMSHLPLVRAIAARVRENLPVQVEPSPFSPYMMQVHSFLPAKLPS